MTETSTITTTLVLTPEQLKAIEHHAQRIYPDECCGVILGRQEDGRRIAEVLIEIENEWDEEERRRRFLITAPQFMRAEKEALQRGLDVLGFYHSHPNAPAKPSEFDREHAWPWYFYPIASVEQGRMVDLKGWQLRDDRSGYDEIELQINEIV